MKDPLNTTALMDKVTDMIENEVDKQMANTKLEDCSEDELILLKRYWEFKQQHAVNRLNLIDDVLTTKRS